MLKKSLICALAIMLLSLCCTVCFANENGNNINLGNEIMRSIDKTENSMKNVVSGNVVRDTGNMINDEINMMQDGINAVEDGMREDGNTVKDGERNVGNSMQDNRDNRNNDNQNNTNGGVVGRNDGDYNATRTSVDQTLNGGINTMTATTWMWIILIVAAVTIMAAIWYYATQGNK